MKRGCTQCGECLNVCPVFREHWKEEYSPKGKRILMEPVERGDAASLSWDDVFDLARLCAGCGRCQKACARKLSTADLLADVRAMHPHWTQRFWEMWIKHMGPLWPSIGFMATLVPEAVTPKPLETSLATAKALRERNPVKPWARIRPKERKQGQNVVLFSGCTARNVRPHWTEKATSLLRAFGHSLEDPSAFTCCGGTMHHAGQYTAMQSMQQQNIAAWKDLGRPGIAVFCASCHHGLRGYDEKNFADENDAQTWRESLLPLSSLLQDASVALTQEAPEAYGYHQPCHWDHDRDMPFLAAAMPGLRKGEGLCCGMGGILKMTDPDISASMAGTCLDGFQGNPGIILSGCSGCVMQLSAFAKPGVTVRHWLDIFEVYQE